MASQAYVTGFVKTAQQAGVDPKLLARRAGVDLKIRDPGPTLTFGYKDMEDAYGTRYGLYGGGIGAATGAVLGSGKNTYPVRGARMLGLKLRRPLNALAKRRVRGAAGLLTALVGLGIGNAVGSGVGRFKANMIGYNRVNQAIKESV